MDRDIKAITKIIELTMSETLKWDTYKRDDVVYVYKTVYKQWTLYIWYANLFYLSLEIDNKISFTFPSYNILEDLYKVVVNKVCNLEKFIDSILEE